MGPDDIRAAQFPLIVWPDRILDSKYVIIILVAGGSILYRESMLKECLFSVDQDVRITTNIANESGPPEEKNSIISM